VTLKTGVMMLISFDHRNKLHFTVYSHRELMIYTGVFVLISVNQFKTLIE